MSALDVLAKNPDAMFGLLLKVEQGLSVEVMARATGLATDVLDVLLDRARNGELTRAGGSRGDTSVFVDRQPIPEPKTEPKPPTRLLLAAPQEPKAMPVTTIERPVGLGIKPSLEWVDVTLIDVDKAYQREVSDKSVAKIVADFRWDHFGAVVLAPHEGGRFMVTDGQHRVRAAQLHPDVTHVPALITGLDGVAAEAENFLTINRARRAVSTIEIYWAGLASGDPATVRVQDVLARAGCQVLAGAGEYKLGHTGAVTAVSRTIERYGEAATVAALGTIRAAWPKDAKALRGTLITALARIHRASEKVDEARLVKVLATRSYSEITAHAETFRKLSGGSPDTVIARTITELYNRGLSSNIIYYGESA